jgi:hypothetical protein
MNLPKRLREYYTMGGCFPLAWVLSVISGRDYDEQTILLCWDDSSGEEDALHAAFLDGNYAVDANGRTPLKRFVRRYSEDGWRVTKQSRRDLEAGGYVDPNDRGSVEETEQVVSDYSRLFLR